MSHDLREKQAKASILISKMSTEKLQWYSLIRNPKGQVIFIVSYMFITSRFGDINCYNLNTGNLSKVPKNAVIQTPSTQGLKFTDLKASKVGMRLF